MISCHDSGTVYVMVGTACSCDTSWAEVGVVTVTTSEACCEEYLDAFEAEKKKPVEGEDVRPVFPRETDRLVTGRLRERPTQLPSTYG
jgi:hypothetical protein